MAIYVAAQVLVVLLTKLVLTLKTDIHICNILLLTYLLT